MIFATTTATILHILQCPVRSILINVCLFQTEGVLWVESGGVGGIGLGHQKQWHHQICSVYDKCLRMAQSVMKMTSHEFILCELCSPFADEVLVPGLPLIGDKCAVRGTIILFQGMHDWIHRNWHSQIHNGCPTWSNYCLVGRHRYRESDWTSLFRFNI